MKFHDDMSHISSELIQRGLMRAVPYSIRLDRYFTDEQMKANREYADSHSDEEWEARCDETRERIAAENLKLMEYLKTIFKIGQYDNSVGYNDCDFWFWCNDLHYTTSGRKTGRDYSYITLTLIEKNDYEANEQVFEAMKKLLTDYPANNIQAIFQYAQIEITENVEKEAERFYNDNLGKFVSYGFMTGKLEKYYDGYIFKKKYAKNHAYRLKPIDVCRCYT